MLNKELILKRFDLLDKQIVDAMNRYGLVFLRIGLGIVFLWFGALKLIPGLSPAEILVRETIYFIPIRMFLPILALWEMLIGLGFLVNRFMRATLLLLFLQMTGTLLPLLLLPDVVWKTFPHVLTLEGQYIVKNLVIIGAGIVLGGSVRSRK